MASKKKKEAEMGEFRLAVLKACAERKITGDGHGYKCVNEYVVMFPRHMAAWFRDSLFAGECFDGQIRLVVSNIDVLGMIVNRLSLETRSFIGRGFQAQEYAKVIYAWAEAQPEWAQLKPEPKLEAELVTGDRHGQPGLSDPEA